MFSPQKVVQNEEVPSSSSQKVEMLSSISPQKVEVRPSNSSEKDIGNANHTNADNNNLGNSWKDQLVQ
jgi:hypothetical protein